MAEDWNMMKSNFSGKALSWEEKDDIQRLLTVFQNDAVDSLNTALELQYVLDFTTQHMSFLNKAPCFWSEVMLCLRSTTVMKSARLFDESKDAIGLQKILNILEQSYYRDAIIDKLMDYRKQYVGYSAYIAEIRTLRDKLYAHNDKKEYQFWKQPQENDLEFEGPFWGVLNEMLKWVRDIILDLRTRIGDGYPVNREITNDLEKLIE